MKKSLIMLGLLAAISVPSSVLAAGAAEEVRVDGAYVRAVPPGLPNSAAFMTLRNGGVQTHTLVGAQSPVAETLELHTHHMEGGMMKMRRVDRIEVPAGGSVALEPGGLHLMLIGLKGNLKPDQVIELTLKFQDQTTQKLQVPVLGIEARQIPQDHSRH